jgi:hypothetical protein
MRRPWRALGRSANRKQTKQVMIAALKIKVYTNNTMQWISNWLSLSASLFWWGYLCLRAFIFSFHSHFRCCYCFNKILRRKTCTCIICYVNYCEVFLSVHSLILIASSILQPNTHYVFATYTFFNHISATRFGVLCTIFRENFVYMLQTVSFWQVCNVSVL